jgi:hypothetical protein
MASTAQVCLPYSGVEKERRCGVALSGLTQRNGKRTEDAPNFMAPSSNSALIC